MGTTEQERYGTQAEIQLRMGTRSRDRQRQARMDYGDKIHDTGQGSLQYSFTFSAGGRDVAVLTVQLSHSPCSGVQAIMVATVALERLENSSVSQHQS